MNNKRKTTEFNIQETTGINRRNFLSNTALAGAGFVLTPLLLSACFDQPKNNNNQGDNKLNSKMKTRKLGKLEVSEMGAGCMSIMANYGPPADRSEGIKVIRTAVEEGVNFFDTAEFMVLIQTKS